MAPHDAQSSSDDERIPLSAVPAYVRQIHFDGVRHTSVRLLRKQVRHLFSPDIANFEQLMAAANDARHRLLELGVFADLELIVDVSKQRTAADSSYDVTFAVQERKRFRLGVSAVSSLDNRASLVTRGVVANMTGGAESLELDWHFGVGHLEEQQRHLTFVKPLENRPSIKFNAGLFDTAADLSWVRLRDHGRGGFVGVHWPTFAGAHSLRLEGQWRHLASTLPPSGVPALPFGLRQECDHYLRWALRHNFVTDGRDDAMLPTRGGLAKVRQELAMGGGGADQAHLLHELELQWNVLLRENPRSGSNVSLQLTSALGVIRSVSANNRVSVVDRFFLGGPLSLRGFQMREAGPRTDDASYPIGGRTYGLAGLHLYSTLPWLGGRGLLQHFRLHAFSTAGCLSSREPTWSEPKRAVTQLMDETRLSAGLGLVVRLFGVARFELNYCWPLLARANDKLCPGVQFGVGMEYH